MMAQRIKHRDQEKKRMSPERRRPQGAGLGLCLLLAAVFWAGIIWLIWG